MSTIFKTRISQQEVQTPVVSADTVVADNFIASSFQSESVSSEEVLADLVSAVTIESDEVFATDTNTTNLVVTNDFSPGGDVIVSSGNVLVSKGGTVSFLDDGEIVEEDGATGFPMFTGIPEILNNGTIYNIGLIDKDTELSGIHFSGNDKMVQTCEIWFSVGDEAHDIYWPENMLWLDSTDGNAPAIVVRTEYRVAIRKEANGSMVASIAYAVGEGSEIVSGNMMEGVARLDADNTFTAGNTFTGAVDMSAASVTPPEGWNVAELTPEAIQQVVPMAWGTWTTAPTVLGTRSLAIGENAKALQWAQAIGLNANADGNYALAVGTNAIAKEYSNAIGSTARCENTRSICIGHAFNETVDGVYTWRDCTTEGTGSITIGAGANTLNNGDTESSNSVTIGCKALSQGADSVVIGAQASGGLNQVVIGAGAKAYYAGRKQVVLGAGSKGTSEGSTVINGTSAFSHAVAIGIGSTAGGTKSVALGDYTTASAYQSTAIGSQANAADRGAVVFSSVAEGGTKTQLYFSGAGTPLANTYEDGEAMMGYVVRDKNNNVMTDAEGNAMVGTQKLSVLFPNNRGENAFTPAMLGLDDEWTPKPMFRPSDLDVPQEEPTEPEEYQPLPVYPIVEPEIEEI